MTDKSTMTFHKPALWTELPKLAERLGVKEGRGSGEVVVMLADGRTYDVLALVNAVLDRMDEAAG